MIFRSPFPDVDIPDVPLTDYVLQRAEELGSKAALIDGSSGRSISYTQLAGAIRQVASSLSQRGFGKADVFAIYSPNVPEYAVAFHAVATLGGVVTTANPLYTASELAHQLKDAGAKYLLTVPMFIDKALEAARQANLEEVFVLGEAEGATPFADLMQGDGQLPEVTINSAEDLVVLPYSSGTTGLPKGVMLTHRNLIANLRQFDGSMGDDALRVNEDDVLLGLLPFYHIYGMVVIMNYALVKGATTIIMPRFDLAQFLGFIQDYKISYAHLVPPIVLALAKHPLVDDYDLSSLRAIFSGAAPLGGDTAKLCAERVGCWVNQGYGMTELSPVSHSNPDSPEEINLASIGPCIASTECMVVDLGSNEPLGSGKTGELWVRGPQVMKGYLNRPDATEATIDAEGWLHTGDIAYADDRHYIFIVDRLKELIKYKGMQVAPAELEEILLTHPDIADAAVIGSPDEEAGEIPKAFVVRRGDVSAEDIMAYVAERVAPHKKIRKLEFVEGVPKSASGKILRRVLLEQERSG